MSFFTSPTTRLILALLSLAALGLGSSCVRRQREGNFSNQPAPRSVTQDPAASPIAPRININTASASELEQLPGVGKVFAQRIVEHRQQYGPFRRPEHLIMVRGMSDKRFRALRDLITAK